MQWNSMQHDHCTHLYRKKHMKFTWAKHVEITLKSHEEYVITWSQGSHTFAPWKCSKTMFHMCFAWFSLGMLRSIGRRSVSADNHILWLDRYSLNLADLRNRSQLMTSMCEDVHDEWGRKCFGAAVISSPVWNYFDVPRNNEKFAICRLCSK